MLKAINAWSLPGAWVTREALPATFRRLHTLGFEGVELNFDPTGEIGFASTAAEMQALRDEAHAAGITLTSLATGAFWATNFGQDDPAKRAVAHQVAVKMLELAQAGGMQTILVVPGAVDIFFRPEEPVVAYDLVYNRVVEGIRRLLPDCERTGVRIGLENVWNRVFLSPLEFRGLIDLIGSPCIGAYFDVGNVLSTGYPEQWIRILGSRIFAVHFKDFRSAVGTGAGFVDLLEGDVNWPEVMRAFQDVGYEGACTAEMGQYRYYPTACVENTSNAMDYILGRKRTY